jgi:hypothetical protein
MTTSQAHSASVSVTAHRLTKHGLIIGSHGGARSARIIAGLVTSNMGVKVARLMPLGNLGST